MSAIHPLDEAAAAATLGELLDRRTAAKGVAEDDWVNLIRSIADGDSRALYVLFECMHQIVYRLAIRITGHREVAEEVAIDVFHDIWHRSRTFETTDGPVVGWIMNLARSRARSRLQDGRCKGREVNTTAGAAGVDPRAGNGALPPERSEHLRRALSLLTPQERSVPPNASFSDSDFPEVARAIDEPGDTIESRIPSGLAKLRFAPGGEGES